MSQSTSDNITILDGGMGRELERIGAPFRQPEWSALSLIEAPNFVTQAHNNFINAGADIITTNAYALVPFHIGQDLFDAQVTELAKNAANIARNCANQSSKPIKVAGCIPPAFGSYKPEAFNEEMLSDILTPLILGQKDDIDFWLVETISSIAEARAIIPLIKAHSNKPIWLSFTLDNDISQSVLRSGEPLHDIIPLLSDIETISFNCSGVWVMENAIKIIRTQNQHIPIAIYANRFAEVKRTHDANASLSHLDTDITPDIYRTYAQKWVNAGATIIGGCCGIGPDYIKALSQYFKDI